ncbi:MAG: hypothetical protein ABIM62_01475, partial [candidate division WOR-3 bacterium]
KDVEEIEKFLRENNIRKDKIYKIDDEKIKKLQINKFPSILYLKDNSPVFWIEGLTLHLKELLKIE